MGCTSSVPDKPQQPVNQTDTGPNEPFRQDLDCRPANVPSARSMAHELSPRSLTREVSARISQRVEEIIRRNLESGDAAIIRQAISALQNELTLAHEALSTVVPLEVPTSRAGHLKTLEDQIGPPPEDRTWQDEWVRMKVASNQRAGRHEEANAEYVCAHQSLETTITSLSSAIERATAIGWPLKRAECFRVLSNPAVNALLSEALASHDPTYSASTHALFNVIHAQRFQQRQERLSLPQRLYWNRCGHDSLSERDTHWSNPLVERGDATGFRGLSGTSLVTVTCSPTSFWSAEGFVQRTRGSDGQYAHETQDSDVVCIETSDDDEFGCHSPVMTSATSGVFPPNCLFRLKDVLAAGTWEAPAQGIFPRQRLLIFSATYRQPMTVWCAGPQQLPPCTAPLPATLNARAVASECMQVRRRCLGGGGASPLVWGFQAVRCGRPRHLELRLPQTIRQRPRRRARSPSAHDGVRTWHGLPRAFR